jgi:predicted RNA binding protein YcfA (HicA-like mRNA interferase family)
MLPAGRCRAPLRRGGGTEVSSLGTSREVAQSQFPTMKARRLLAVLQRQPLSYRTIRRAGSHRRMESPIYPPLTFAFHDRATVPSRLVRKILTEDVGLAEDEARRLV